MRPKIGDKVMTSNHTKTSKSLPVFGPDMMEVIELEGNGAICEDSLGRKQRRHLDDVKIPRGAVREDTSTDLQTAED